MLEDFDIVALPDGGYQLVAGGLNVLVEFDNPIEKEQFDFLVNNRNRPARSLYKDMIKKFSKNKTLQFFDKLRQNGILVFNEEESLEKGHILNPSEARRTAVETLSESISVLTSSSFGAVFKNFLVFRNSQFIDLRKITNIKDVCNRLRGKAFVLVESGSINLGMLRVINATFLKHKIPWFLFFGIYERVGLIGPLFMGNDTGCFECLWNRMRSNARDLQVFDRYEKFLVQNKKFGVELKAASDAFLYNLAAITTIEIERFLLDEGLPQSYGYLASVDPYTHAVEWHRLYRVPFCDVCNRNFEYRRAPWLDEVTLGDICAEQRGRLACGSRVPVRCFFAHWKSSPQESALSTTF